MLNGQIDHCQGRYIFGWAISVRNGDHCRITVADPFGQTIAEAVASEPRGDLAALDNGRIDFSFRVGVPAVAGAGPVQVFADGVEIPGSPLFLLPDIFDGGLWIDRGVVSGWVSNRQAVSATGPVLLHDQDGHLVATLAATLDPAGDDPLFRPALFSAPLPADCFGRVESFLTAQIGGAAFARAMGPSRLEGYLDTISDTACAGWLFSPDAPGRCFELEVYRDDVLVGAGATTLPRGDVSARYLGLERCGFELTMRPSQEPRRGLSHVSMRIVGSNHELFGGPFLIGSRGQAIQDAYAAASAIQCSAPLSGIGAGLLRDALGEWLRAGRAAAGDVRVKTRSRQPAATARRVVIVVPVYGDVAATRVCLDSVLRVRREGIDSIVIVNDNPGDAAIADLVDAQSRHADVFVLRNARNEGFIGAVNRAMAFVRCGDVLLLNADTELFAGAIDEMHSVLHGRPDIGTVTALSNNATLFSYPHPTIIVQDLDDISWPALAAVALRENAGKTVAIPTAHGFCMLIRRAVMDEIGLLDRSFGRGYGEENDYSLRAADCGWRHVAAGGVLVRHVEAVSFGADKQALVAANLRLVHERFPEYASRIDLFAAADGMRALRWALDFHRLRQLADGGTRFELVIDNGMDGGMQLAVSDIEGVVRAPDLHALRLTGMKDGRMHLRLDGLRLLSVFQPDDTAELFRRLASLTLDTIVVHHLLGFDEDFVRHLRDFMATRRSVFHIHDFYYACPRVTLIDASGAFCGGAASERCQRCVGMGGAHLAYRMGTLSVADHRELFQEVLTQASHLIAPSEDTAERLAALIPLVRPVAVPHPQTGTSFPIGVRRGSATDICLLGAIGPHKGSATLLALARHARLNFPEFRFHVIGFTNVDRDLSAIGNVTVFGKYDRDDLPALVEVTQSRIALFLHGWPETFSYTLTEAVGLGLIPVVPDIGAPAERVRGSGFGVVFPFPIDVGQVLTLLGQVADGTVGFSAEGALPLRFDTSDSQPRLRALYRGGVKLVPPVVARRPGRRRVAGP